MTNLRRFGVLAPPGNTALELELPSIMPAGVTSNHNRLSRPGAAISSDSLLQMADSIERAAHDLAQAHPEIILYGCTSGSFLAGIGREAEVAQRIADSVDIPAVTTSTAVIAALRAINARNIFMITPYPDDINLHEIAFLDHYGIKVSKWDAFRCKTSEAIRELTSDRVADLVRQHASEIKGCDAVFISCTNLLSIDQISRLERELDKPVISSNQASLWAVLQHMQINTKSIAAGHLFACSVPVEVSHPRH